MKVYKQIWSFDDIERELTKWEYLSTDEDKNRHRETVIDHIDSTFKYARDFIKCEKHSLDAYNMLFERFNKYIDSIAKWCDIDIYYIPTYKELKGAYLNNKEYYNRLTGFENISCVFTIGDYTEDYTFDDDDMIDMFKSELADEIRLEIKRRSPYCEQYKRFEDILTSLICFYSNDNAERKIVESIINYKLPKEQHLQLYFECENIERLKSILHNDLRGKRGKDVAMVLVALERIGCNLNGDFKPLFDNILSPIYGVVGSRQAVTDQIPKIRTVTESSDPKIAKQITEISEKYRILLQ